MFAPIGVGGRGWRAPLAVSAYRRVRDGAGEVEVLGVYRGGFSPYPADEDALVFFFETVVDQGDVEVA